jgi:hypothetical protein
MSLMELSDIVRIKPKETPCSKVNDRLDKMEQELKELKER